MALEKLPYDETQPLVDNQLGEDQERQRDEKAQLRFDIIEKRHRNRAPRRGARDGREYNQRQPHDQRDDTDAAPHEVERIAREIPATKKLMKRPAENQREILRRVDFCERVFTHGSDNSAHCPLTAEASSSILGRRFVPSFISSMEKICACQGFMSR